MLKIYAGGLTTLPKIFSNLMSEVSFSNVGLNVFESSVTSALVSAVDGTTYVSGSVSASAVGEWPTLDLYKYNTKGFVSFTSSFNKGNWQMQTNYSNVRFADHTGSLAPIPQATLPLP